MSFPQIAGRPVSDWEASFKREIEERLKTERLDSIVYEITETDVVDNFVVKKKGENQVRGTTTILAPIVTESATPTKIELEAPIEVWRQDSNVRLDFLFLELAREIAEGETRTVLESLKSGGKQFKAKKAPITTGLLKEAYESTEGFGQHADTLIVHPFKEAELLKESRELLNAWQLPEQMRATEGPHFTGILGIWSVYWTPFIDENTLLLYTKMEVREKRTPLKVKIIETAAKELVLTVREDCLAWAVDDTAVAVIRLEE